MTLVADNVYSYTASQVYQNVIFNNGNGTQTSDLTLVNGHIYTSDGNHQAYNGSITAVPADQCANLPAEYYNLQGVRVANPAPGLYIVRRGTLVTKELVK
jgi:GTP-dependent phosphoenolpyruvate carboxykinase